MTSSIEILTSNDEDNTEESDVSTCEVKNDNYKKLIVLCRKSQEIPDKYIEDLNKMYVQCNRKQRNSDHLCKLISEAINHISFHSVAKLYNELLQLTKFDSFSSQSGNCVASTSNGNGNLGMSREQNSGTLVNKIDEINQIFNEFIEKCYQNNKFPKANIETIDKLYNSLPSEFIESEVFVSLLIEANQIIWPDSNSSSYMHVDDVYKQLQQFEASMKVQNTKTPVNENREVNKKKLQKLKKLRIALKIVRKKIKDLEEEEMDINNDTEFNSDSAYVLTDRYEKRALEIYKRMCKIQEEPDFLDPPPLRFNKTNNPLVNRAIEKYYNVKQLFPSYFEIYTLIKLLNESKNLNWTETEIKDISQDAFLKLGKQLKVTRINEYLGRLTNFTSEKDPAEENEELKKKLDESNKKMHADLNALTEKFHNKQEEVEETDGSSLNDTECENSSEDEDSEDNNTKLQSVICTSTKRKIYSSSESESDNDKHHKKAKPISVKRRKTLATEEEDEKNKYMESFNLKPCVVRLELITNLPNMQNKVTNVKTCVKSKKNSNKLTINMNSCDKIVKNSNEVNIEPTNIEALSTNVPGTAEMLEIEDDTLVDDESTSGNLVIDEFCSNDDRANQKISEEPQKNIAESDKSEENRMNISSITIDSEENGKNPFEPEVNINEDVSNDCVIEINDSDVEPTSCSTPKPPKHKKSLETIIKELDFEKKYKWDQQPRTSNSTSSLNLNQNCVNRWVINNPAPPTPRPPPPSNMHMRYPNSYMPPTLNRMPLDYQMRNMTQKNYSRQCTQRFSNSAQQQRNFMNNHSILQQQITTMTTTTTVRRKIIQQSSETVRQPTASRNQVRCPASTYRTRRPKTPELIELDD